MGTQLPTAADLRARMARERAMLYVVAAQVGVDPSRLGSMLNERSVMPEEVARKVAAVLDGWDAEGGQRAAEASNA